jgi:hypothetical protein
VAQVDGAGFQKPVARSDLCVRRREQAIRHGIELHPQPLPEDAPIHLSPACRPTAYPDGQVLGVGSITLTPDARSNRSARRRSTSRWPLR